MKQDLAVIACLFMLAGSVTLPVSAGYVEEVKPVSLDSLKKEMGYMPVIQAVNTKYSIIAFQITKNTTDLILINEQLKEQNPNIRSKD